ncbi:MAG: hypothetical protein WC208_13895 [Gallionella sp.]|jgi:hypothetical protein
MDITTFLTDLDQGDTPVKDKPRLIEALKELSSLVGMKEVKKEVIAQLLFLITNIKLKGLAFATDSHLLHTLIIGSPGCGKTQLGLILSKIWSSLGILGSDTPASDTLTTRLFRDNVSLIHSNKVISEQLERAETAASATLSKVREMRSRLFALRTQCKKDPSKSVDENISRLARVSADALSYSSMTCKSLGDQGVEDVKDVKKVEIETVLPPAEAVFKIVSRVNFVAEYVGQTATKTRKLLEEYKGGVLFVDEAYSLYHGDRDSFGAEALTVINQYMTENSDSTVLIFAGYGDIMKSTIFKAQPGLARRFAFTFEIPSYTAEELADIFLVQLKADDWHYEDRNSLIEFFTTHYSFFPSWGGDTKRLIFQSKLIYTTQHWKTETTSRHLTRDILDLAFIRYKAHQPLDVSQLKQFDAQRVYEEEVLSQRIREHKEIKAHEKLYDEFREVERAQMLRKVRENQERLTHEELYTASRKLEREELERKLKESEKQKEYDRRERPEYMYV